MRLIAIALPILSLVTTMIGTIELWSDERAEALKLLLFGGIVVCLTSLICVIVLKDK